MVATKGMLTLPDMDAVLNHACRGKRHCSVGPQHWQIGYGAMLPTVYELHLLLTLLSLAFFPLALCAETVVLFR